jgi:beta-galactosidase/beta-glucuronidase
MKCVIPFLALAASALAQPLPRPEYPQPQFQREAWMNLNGKWDFDFDDHNAGLAEFWAGGTHRFTRNITIPFCFESRNSGIADTAFHPWAWYRREFAVPAAWSGKHVLLHFGAVDYRAMVWVNSHLAGEHEGGNVPFTFDVTNYLKPDGPNVIVVRAEDPPTDRYIPRGKQYWEPKPRSIFYTRTSGIWQTVWMEPVGDSFVESVRITPNMDGLASIYAHLRGNQPELTFRTTVSFGGSVIATTTAVAAQPRVSTTASITDPRLWSPNSPNLYDVTFELLRGDRVVDKVQSYFGFRTVATDGRYITLNGRPIYPKMVLDQGYWPDSILTPPSDEAIQYDIKATQDMGFNGARKHQKLEDPRYLYWADKMGLLVSSEMANAYLFDDESVERFTKEWMAAVERDYNHPSIIMWVPINESWGVPNLRDPRQQNHLKELYALTRALDNTRLVIDNDGWEHTDMTDLFTVHDYARSGEALAEKYKDLGKPGGSVPDNGRPALAPGYKYNGTPVLLSEFGGIAYIPQGHDVPAESWGYSGVEKTDASALERLKGLYLGIAKVPGFVGICYTQLTDVEQEINGLLTYDRKPKFPVAAVREINGLAGVH